MLDLNAELVDAVKKGKTSVVQGLLHNGANADAKDKSSVPVLIKAARRGYLDIVQVLLDRGADVNVRDRHGFNRTALIWAARRGHSAIVEALVEKGVDVNAKDDRGRTALMKAIEYNHIKIFDLLKKAGAIGNSDLINAVRKGEAAIVRALLNKGVKPDSRDKDGVPAIVTASKAGYVEVVELLLDNGADIDAKDIYEYHRTALIWATRQGHVAVVETLLDNGADFRVKDKFERTALMKAAEYGHTRIVELLKQAGAVGNNEIMDAVNKGNAGIVQILLEHGADADAEDENGISALIKGAGKGFIDIVEVLLRYGADVEAKDKHGYNRTALIWAARMGHVAVLNALLDTGANVNAIDDQRRTAFMKAVEHNHTRIAEILKQAGAAGSIEYEVSREEKKHHPDHRVRVKITPIDNARTNEGQKNKFGFKTRKKQKLGILPDRKKKIEKRVKKSAKDVKEYEKLKRKRKKTKKLIIYYFAGLFFVITSIIIVAKNYEFLDMILTTRPPYQDPKNMYRYVMQQDDPKKLTRYIRILEKKAARLKRKPRLKTPAEHIAPYINIKEIEEVVDIGKRKLENMRIRKGYY